MNSGISRLPNAIPASSAKLDHELAQQLNILADEENTLQAGIGQLVPALIASAAWAALALAAWLLVAWVL